jgi:hypothetical protein
MIVTKGLIIDTPWVDQILSGQKMWEMRTTSTSHRGWFGLIRKGSGAVYGVARLDESGPKLSVIEMLATTHLHRIPEKDIGFGADSKYRIPWKLSGAHRLARPIPYRHKQGAVIWIHFDNDVSKAIASQLEVDPSFSTKLAIHHA